MELSLLDGSLNPVNVARVVKHNHDFFKTHPGYSRPEGLLVFCGEQGSGKALSAVQYVGRLCEGYPRAILCTNVQVSGLPPATEVIEYDGLEYLENLENGYYGVICSIDKIHLKFNGLGSKNIDIEVMIEVSQQRKQGKRIIGMSQVYGGLVKPFREWIRNVVLCSSFCRLLQINTLIDGAKSTEKNGKLITESVKRFFWFHRPELYDSYDTYAEIRRCKKEWQGRRLS